MWHREPALLLFCSACAAATPVAEQAPTAYVGPIAPMRTPEPRAAASPSQRKESPPPSPSPSPYPSQREGRPSPATLDNTLVPRLLAPASGSALKAILADPATHRFQVLYSLVREGARPSLDRHGHRLEAEYFFPASAMKMPIALALYDRLAILRRNANNGAMTRAAAIRIHSPIENEPFSTTLEHETWRALIISDNASANRLLSVVGHREANETLWADGLNSTRIHTGFATGSDIDPAEESPRVEFSLAGQRPAELSARKSTLALPPTHANSLDVGKANIVDGKRIDTPLSFARKNAMRIMDLQDALVRIMRPDLLPSGAPVDPLSADDRAFLQRTLGTTPSESGIAGYDRNVILDYQFNPLLRGVERVRPKKEFSIYSKVGQAYGFIVANAYVVDEGARKAFFLTACVYANPDEVLNDDVYAYDAVSIPALADVAEIFARHAFSAG